MHTSQSDVEMVPPGPHEALDDSDSADDSEETASPPPSPPPAHHSPIPVDDDSHPSSAELAPPPPAADASASSAEPAAPAEGARGRKSKPSSSNVAAAPSGAKPKSSKSAVPRPSTPSPPPPPARQPLQTIRLEIQLGGPEDYEVNISDLAKATGQRPATPVPEALKRGDTSDESDADEDGGHKSDAKQQPQGKRRKKVSILLVQGLRHRPLSRASQMRIHPSSRSRRSSCPHRGLCPPDVTTHPFIARDIAYTHMLFAPGL